jgi:hypothetical protein
VKALAIVASIMAASGVGHADRPLHGSIGFGGSFLTTGDDGDRLRLEAELDVEPYSRFGGLVALRAFDDHHRGLLMGGLVYEAAAARPLLVIDLHADAGADLDQRAPLAGGGIRFTLTIIGPLAVAYDGGGYLVIDGVARTRFVLSVCLAIVARF